ncbi:hypothetical protein J2Y74_003679 [Pseudomonas migulae]|uniref:hypothetical protein n=1 Tax=Pseudomonas migulae TaxID=78543 RepID=UPI0020A230B3|nr:hypothetical protein [Pseudomonas migulae]MCP1519369.1 hypothetical protein [Pseudomonas migulae]
MSNELDTLSAGELQPYSEGVPILAPHNHDSWSGTDVDLLREDHQRQSGGVRLFGNALPAGTTTQQVEAMLGQLGGAFMADFSSLGFPNHMVQAAINFMSANAAKAPYQVRQQHNFNLHGQDDYLGHAFGNMVQSLSGSPRAKQQFVTACLQWLTKAVKQLSKAPEGSGDMPRMAPNSTEAMLNSLSDSDYNKVIKINEQALAKTLDILAARWGHVFKQNIQIAQDYLSQLPSADQAHFDQFTTGWVHMRNTPEFISEMFNAATGAHSIGNNGASIAKEIAECERCMKTNRKQWLADNALQARYRTLLTIRDGG